MARLCVERTGLFPSPQAIEFRCSCPDDATMCKHVAAALYGVGARLDREPELLFTLRGASVDDLVTAALSGLTSRKPASARVLAADGLAQLFGIELARGEPASPVAAPSRSRRRAAPKAKRVKKATKVANPRGRAKRCDR